jgi:hypothetical protein
MHPSDDDAACKKRKMKTGGTMANKQDQNGVFSTLSSSEDQNPSSLSSGAGFYEIHVKGHLNDKWSDWLEGLEIERLDNGEMILIGPIVDQAALIGILNKLSRLNLALLSVNEVNKKHDWRKNA